MKLFSRFRKPKPQIMISIPDPCNEKWSAMKKVDDCRRHCAACDRVLTDFAGMDDDELLLFFKHSEARLNDGVGQGKICGRFRSDQLNRGLIPLPEKTSKAIWWKAAALLPFSLFSKSATAQQLQPDSAKTEQVPYMVAMNDSAVPVTINTNINWNWIDNEEGPPSGPYALAGGVPMMVYTFPAWDWSNLCYTLVTAPTDTIPHAETTAGVSAGASPSPKKIPNGAAAVGFANNLNALTPRKD